MQLILLEQREKYITLPNKLNSMKNKNKPYKIAEHFDVEHITEFLISQVEDGEISIEQAIKHAALEGAANEWFDTRFNMNDLIGMEYDTELNRVEWDMQKDYQKI